MAPPSDIRFACTLWVHHRLLPKDALAMIVSVTTSGLLRFAEGAAARDLAANARVFDEILDIRARQMGDQADVLARDFGFRGAVADRVASIS